MPEVGQFLQSVAQTDHDPLRALAASRTALDFLYREVLHLDLGELPWPRPPRLLDQARQVLRVRHYALTAEACDVQGITRFILFPKKRHPRDRGAAEVEQSLTQLAVNGQIVVRAGKGNKDRVVMLPRCARAELERQLTWRQQLHERDLARGVARVELPEALQRQCPRAAQELGWQFAFASRQMSRCPRTDRFGRHHVYPSSLQRAVARGLWPEVAGTEAMDRERAGEAICHRAG